MTGPRTAHRAPRGRPAPARGIRQLIRRGAAAFEAGDYSAAEPLLRQAAACSQRYANVFHMLGLIASHQGRPAEAIDLFREALRVNPRYDEAQINLAITLAEAGASDLAAAEADTLQARERAPDRPDRAVLGKLANGHAALAARYRALGLFRQALREYDEALELCDDFPDLHRRRAAICRALGDHRGAESALRRALELHPGYVEAHVELGRVYAALGRGPEARRAWEQALALDPAHALARIYLAQADRGVAEG
jgi:tetratricopeptide (TPR) repeat protein